MNNVKIHTGLSGRYMLEATDVVTGEKRVVADWFDNIITDVGMNQIAVQGVFERCRVGSGSATPSTSDTQLQAQVASTSTVNGTVAGVTTTSPYFRWVRLTYRFAAGVAAGNLSEVGVGWNDSGPTLFSRALIKDSNGTPTTITVLSTEVLDVTYELRLYVDENDVVQTINVSGTNRTFTLRNAAITNVFHTSSVLSWGFGSLGNTWIAYAYSGAIGPLTGGPAGSSSSAGSYTQRPYVQNSRQHIVDVTFGLNDANTIGGTINSLSMQWVANMIQIGVSPGIPKTPSNIFKIALTYSWARR